MVREKLLEESNVKVEEEFTQGERLYIKITRGGFIIKLPIKLEGIDNINTMRNVLRLVKEVLITKTGKELVDKFSALVVNE